MTHAGAFDQQTDVDLQFALKRDGARHDPSPICPTCGEPTHATNMLCMGCFFSMGAFNNQLPVLYEAWLKSQEGK